MVIYSLTGVITATKFILANGEEVGADSNRKL